LPLGHCQELEIRHCAPHLEAMQLKLTHPHTDISAAYEALGLPYGASLASVKKAFRHLARLHHPDTSTSGSSASEFSRCKIAYEKLLTHCAAHPPGPLPPPSKTSDEMSSSSLWEAEVMAYSGLQCATKSALPQLATPIESQENPGVLGLKYLMGQGVSRNLATAARFFSIGAEQGDIRSMHIYGLMLGNGAAVERDGERSVELLTRAAMMGYAPSQRKLASLAAAPLSGSPDWLAAEKWLRMAALQGDPHSQFELASLYYSGRTGRCDYSAALAWFNAAAVGGHARSQNNAAAMLLNGKGARHDPAAALQWLEVAASAGVPEANYNMGLVAELGMIPPPDARKAANFYRLAARSGVPSAHNNLGVLYYRGEGVPEDLTLAAEHFARAASLGSLEANSNLGLMYCRGEGVAKDHKKAAVCFLAASEMGDASSKNNLGVLCYGGLGVPRDPSRAASLFLEAANLGDASAQLNIAMMYLRGDGVEENMSAAFRWFSMSAKQGNEDAQNQLSKMASFPRASAAPADNSNSSPPLPARSSPSKLRGRRHCDHDPLAAG